MEFIENEEEKTFPVSPKRKGSSDVPGNLARWLPNVL
jgi:hypothetical protein